MNTVGIQALMNMISITLSHYLGAEQIILRIWFP